MRAFSVPCHVLIPDQEIQFPCTQIKMSGHPLTRTLRSVNSSGDLSGCQGRASPLESEFFLFHVVFGKIFAK